MTATRPDRRTSNRYREVTATRCAVYATLGTGPEKSAFLNSAMWLAALELPGLPRLSGVTALCKRGSSGSIRRNGIKIGRYWRNRSRPTRERESPGACRNRGFVGATGLDSNSGCLFDFLKPILKIVLGGSYFNNVVAQLAYHPLDPPA